MGKALPPPAPLPSRTVIIGNQPGHVVGWCSYGAEGFRRIDLRLAQVGIALFRPTITAIETAHHTRLGQFRPCDTLPASPFRNGPVAGVSPCAAGFLVADKTGDAVLPPEVLQDIDGISDPNAKRRAKARQLGL